MLFSCSMVRSPSVRKLNCSENTVFATTTPGHRNTIPVLRSCLDTETVFQLVLKYLCPIGFDFNFKHAAFLCLELVLLQKNILGAYADIGAPDNGFLSQKFPNKAATVGGHVQSHLCNVLKKNVWRAREKPKQKKYEKVSITLHNPLRLHEIWCFIFQVNSSIIFWSIL